MSVSTTHSSKSANYLPRHICNSFESELKDLVDLLAKTEGYKGAYLQSEFLTKYVSKDTAPADVRRTRAIKKWLGVEDTNERTNTRLMFGDQDLGYVNSDALFSKARYYISKTLGACKPENIFVQGSHSNGASTRVRRSPKAAIDKHDGIAHVSSSALKHWYTFASNSRLSRQCLSIQEANVMFTVPKSTEIDRVACKEPEINMLLQRCAGTYIRNRLKRVGIDLLDQTNNQSLARKAYSSGLATIDLSSASDSISKSLVMNLLPTDWWSLLDDIRVHYTDIDGTDRKSVV